MKTQTLETPLITGSCDKDRRAEVKSEVKKQLWLAGPMIAGNLLQNVIQMISVMLYEENMTKLTEFYRQRAKKHWATHGDKNSRYFHISVLKRRRRNRIVSINNDKG